jgi:hypothetical protein
MNTRRLYVLLVLWSCFLVAPAALMELGLFGRVDTNTNLPGGLAGLWVVGYLAQFGIFLWIMNIVPKQKMLWWFVASLLPFAVDWTSPVSPLFFVAGLFVTAGMAWWIAWAARREESLQHNGIRATGTVLEVLEPKMNVVINNVYIKRKVRLRIERQDGAPAYEGILDGLFMLGRIPSPGDRMPLIVDPANPQRFEYDERKDAAPAQARAAARPATTSRPGNIAEELEKLSELRTRGVLTDSEFAAAKRKLLNN